MLEQIEQLDRQAAADLAAVTDADSLEQFRIKYLGTKGALKSLMANLKKIPPDQKAAFGKRANACRQSIQQAYDDRAAQLKTSAKPSKGPMIDVTEPGYPSPMGTTHVITQTIDDLIEVFGRMGFAVATGPQVEDEYHNFVALNIPESHPARDPLDNFFLQTAETTNTAAAAASGGGGGGGGTSGDGGARMLRSQTSTIQIRVMENQPPPVRIIALGRVYRPDEHDATHYSMFHQIEGLYVDEHVSMSDLKTTLIQFAHAYFGPEAEVRLRPSYFPFTEPSAELDIKMQVKDTWDWVEIGGCGMVDPNVFQAVGYDPERYTGFAFGLGIERIAMRKFGITDIRWLYENDVRFLRQF